MIANSFGNLQASDLHLFQPKPLPVHPADWNETLLIAQAPDQGQNEPATLHTAIETLDCCIAREIN